MRHSNRPKTGQPPARDAGVADIVGTILLIGVTVSFVALAALQLGAAQTPPSPVRLELSATGSGPDLTLLHLAGDAMDKGDLKAIVVADDAILHEAAIGPAGTTWAVGDTVVLTLPTELPGGSVEVSIVHIQRGELLATATVVTPRAVGPAPADFVVAATLNGTSTAPRVRAPAQLLVEAGVSHGEGRKLLRHVYANLSEVDGPLWVALRDDGTRGDATAGDSLWSGLLNIPASAPRGSSAIEIVAVDLRGAEARTTVPLQIT